MEDSDEEYEEAVRRNPRLRQLLDAFNAMSDADQARFVRLSERVAALPKEVQAAITPEQMRRMMDEDSDFPYN